MLNLLRNHPFAVEAFFKSSLVLTFAVKVDEIKKLLPDFVEPDTYDNKWGFVAVAIVQTNNLRPKGFPQFLGSNFILVGYRVFVRYTNRSGKNIRGLYILQSETDSRRMEIFGNIFTHYKYSTTDIRLHEEKNSTTFSSKNSGFKVEVMTANGEVSLPEDSPFPDWKTARRYAGPLPFTFTVDSQKKEVLIIEGVRQHWEPVPVKVSSFNLPFLSTLNFSQTNLANAFLIRDIPYYWKKGVIDRWSA